MKHQGGGTAKGRDVAGFKNHNTPLFFNSLRRFLLALVDPSPAVRQLAEYLLRDVLAVKAPLLAYNHFVEAIFVLNGCTAGLHGARLGANLGSSGGGGGVSAAGGGGAGGADEGGGGGGGGQEGGVLGTAAPAQFMLKGKQHRWVCVVSVVWVWLAPASCHTAQPPPQ
jgi:hypothetical protein